MAGLGEIGSRVRSLAGLAAPQAQEMFDALGISASDLARLTPDETFLAVADALEKLPIQA